MRRDTEETPDEDRGQDHQDEPSDKAEPGLHGHDGPDQPRHLALFTTAQRLGHKLCGSPAQSQVENAEIAEYDPRDGENAEALSSESTDNGGQGDHPHEHGRQDTRKVDHAIPGDQASLNSGALPHLFL